MGGARGGRVCRTAVLVTTAAVAMGVATALPSPAWAANGVTVLSVEDPGLLDDNNTATLHLQTAHGWLAPPRPSDVTAFRVAKTDDVVEASEVSFDPDHQDPSFNHYLVVTFDFHQANPGAYGLSVTGPSATDGPMPTDTCASCVALQGATPTVTKTEPATVGAAAQHPNWAVIGTEFTRGPYTQCTSLTCPTDQPTIQVTFNGSADPAVTGVTLTDSPFTSDRGKLWKVLNVAANATPGVRTVTVFNSNNTHSNACACLTVAPAAVATSVSPNSYAAGQAGVPITITGHDFPSDSVPSFKRRSNGASGDVHVDSYQWVSSTQIRATVTIPSGTPTGDEDLLITTKSVSTTWTFSGLFAIGSTPTLGPTEGAPTNAKATPGNKQAVVQWTPPPNTSSNPIIGYSVRTLPSGSPSTPAPPSASSATVTGLTNGKSYQFSVRVTYQSGHTFDSAATAAVTPAGPPSAPRNVKAKPGDRRAKVSWSAPSTDNGGFIDSYTVTASPGGKRVIVPTNSFDTPPATSTTVRGLKNGTAYSFVVTAHNNGGNSPESAASIPVTPRGIPTLTLKAPYAVDTGKRADLHGRLLDSEGVPIGNARLRLQQRHSGAHDWDTLTKLTTGGEGRWSYRTHRLHTTTRYRVKWAGNNANAPARTGRFVRVRETGRITAPDDGDTVPAGSVTVLGVASSPRGLPVDLQVRRGGKWRNVDTDEVGAHHRVVLHVTLSAGTARLRLLVEGALGTIAGHSKVVTITVA